MALSQVWKVRVKWKWRVAPSEEKDWGLECPPSLSRRRSLRRRLKVDGKQRRRL